jgi:hypothetical protein
MEINDLQIRGNFRAVNPKFISSPYPPKNSSLGKDLGACTDHPTSLHHPSFFHAILGFFVSPRDETS